MIKYSTKGDFANTFKFLRRDRRSLIMSVLRKYGELGKQELSRSTPVDTGLTSSSWTYEVRNSGHTYTIAWSNNNTVNGIPVVILLQYGHSTGTGGYVRGVDFINPTMKPIFEKIKNEIWKEVSKWQR